MDRRCCLAAALLALAAARGVWSQGAGESTQMGIYSGSGGSCGYAFANGSEPVSGGYQGSINTQDALVAGLPLSGCGACVRVACNFVGNQGACNAGAQPITLSIVDSCPTCQLNAPLLAFDAITNTNLGSVNVQAQLVPCPAAGSLKARILSFRPQDAGGSYLKMVLINAAGSGSLSRVAVRSSGSQGPWIPMANTYGAAFELSMLPAFPLDLQLVNAYGQTLTISGALPNNPTGDVDLGANFPAGAAPGPGAAVPAPAAPSAAPQPQVDGPAAALPALPLRTRRLQQLTITGLDGGLGALLNAIISGTIFGAPPAPPPLVIQPLPSLPPPPPPPAPGLPQVVISQLPPAPGVVVFPGPAQPPSRPPAAVSAPQPPPPGASPPPAAPAVPPPVAQSPPPVPVQAVPPAGPLQIAPSLAPGAACRQINDWLQASPSLSTWYSLLQRTGYANSLAQPNVSVTMLAPVNAAFSAPVFEGTTVGESNNVSSVADLLAADPSSGNPLVGYHLLLGTYPTARLSPGAVINTTDTLKQFGVNDQTLTISIPASGQIKGVGSSATILDADLPACGPSVIQVIDHVLLPFSPDSSTATPPSQGQAVTGRR